MGMNLGERCQLPASPVLRGCTNPAIQAEGAATAALTEVRCAGAVAAPLAQLWAAVVAEVLALHEHCRH